MLFNVYKSFIQTKTFVLDEIFMCLVNVLIKLLQNGYSSKEGTIFPDVLGCPLLPLSNTDHVPINLLCRR